MKEINGNFRGVCRLDGKKVTVSGVFSSFGNPENAAENEIVHITYQLENVAGNEAFLKRIDGKWKYGRLNENVFQVLPSDFHDELTLLAIKAYTEEKIQILKAE